ncbi:multidrug resistance protein 3 [Streptococcus pneumoniae]|nr:multidrug resistance protein 3 [Streptococcus pneumoniae]VJO76411.1 multidrug resistance protein 3 [Streptococcus pneumoniae]VJU67523.1 multidrug resistance protein 3 [Streptococcus pneumoniae]VKF12103.1 multidrug resistance protein 3 [Streptococcus pneumoniae]VKY83356.1 multidrug resistance protein 3 [Streptococcus pneumoniae]
MGFLLMGALFIVLPRTMVSAKRINQVLDLHSSIQNPVQVQLTDENFKGQVEFKDVTFRYAANSEAVIEHVSFKAETGQTVAFIGSTGSGKSTLVNLIPRFYDVSAGEILVDGVNVQDYDFSATAHAGQKVAIVGPTGTGKTTIVNLLMKFYEIDKGSIHIDGVDTKAMTRSEVHDAFSMVLQDTWLFEGTIRDNLIYNQIAISDERMMEASKAVGIHHFIMTLPDGYDTILDDTVTLSVGQKQLLTIARALLKDAPLLILDEATSSVDTRTEELIQKAMDRLMEGRTSFVIAHRLSTIRNADLILVMKDGNIIEQGNYEELMAQGGFYADLYNSQFTEDEQKNKSKEGLTAFFFLFILVHIEREKYESEIIQYEICCCLLSLDCKS